MLPYWLLYTFCSVFVIGGARLERSRPSTILLVVFGILVAMLIGFRFRVGADWFTYQYHFMRTMFMSFGSILGEPDPGYYLLNWLAHELDVQLWFVNLLCGILFAAGLISFARTLPQPWLGLVVAVPYLITVVAMGYSRQAVAIGVVMLGLAALARGRVPLFIFWVVIATFFHKTAFLMAPFAALASAKGRVVTVPLVLFTMGFLYYTLVLSSVDRLVDNYIVAEYNSQGTAIRLAMNAIPAMIFLAYRKNFHLPPQQQKLWLYFSYAAFGSIALFFILPSTTALDRMALYIIPLQLVVASWLPQAFAINGKPNQQVTLGIVLYAGIVLFTWLNFANHAKFWVPYQLFPF